MRADTPHDPEANRGIVPALAVALVALAAFGRGPLGLTAAVLAGLVTLSSAGRVEEPGRDAPDHPLRRGGLSVVLAAFAAFVAFEKLWAILGFALFWTPYQIVVAGADPPPPLRRYDVVVVHRGDRASLSAGQLVQVRWNTEPRLAELVATGPAEVPLDRLALPLEELERARAQGSLTLPDSLILVRYWSMKERDAPRYVVPRRAVRGRAIAVILPLVHARRLP